MRKPKISTGWVGYLEGFLLLVGFGILIGGELALIYLLISHYTGALYQ